MAWPNDLTIEEQQLKIKSLLIKDISNVIFNQAPFYYNDNQTNNVKYLESVENFRKIISDGGVSNTTGQQNQLVLYQQDYQAQKPPTAFDTFIDDFTKCYCDGEVVLNQDGSGHTCTDNYTEYISGNLTISFVDDSSEDGTEFNPWEEIEVVVSNNQCTNLPLIVINQNVLSILSQYIPFDYTQVDIDPIQANQVLDTNIFELLPQVSERQQQINKFFSDYSNLKGDYPTFVDDNPVDGLFDTPTDRDVVDISTNNPNGFIPRLDQPSDDVNDVQNLQWLRDDLNLFLRDVDQRADDDFDDRPIYVDKSDGYLKIRHMNQFIILRKEEGTDVGIQDSYLTDGFTITMWVKFLDKVNGGTLFNFGNPLRENNPMGFMLETFIVETDEENQRYLRLVVREEDNGEGGMVDGIRDSHFGIDGQPRLDTINGTGGLPALEHDSNYASNYTQVPIDLTEWYFIVANYLPSVDEDNSEFDLESVNQLPEYWQWNYSSENNSYTSFSNEGAKCKVEIISKSDLIRARGFRQ